MSKQTKTIEIHRLRYHLYKAVGLAWDWAPGMVPERRVICPWCATHHHVQQDADAPRCRAIFFMWADAWDHVFPADKQQALNEEFTSWSVFYGETGDAAITRFERLRCVKALHYSACECRAIAHGRLPGGVIKYRGEG